MHDRTPIGMACSADDLERMKRFLWDEWDPIALKGYGPTDEYDRYAPQVLRMVLNGASAEAIAAHLDEIAVEQIALRANPTHSFAVAVKALALFRDTD